MPGYVGGDRLEVAVGLRVPGIDVAGAAFEPEQDDGFRFAVRESRLRAAAESASRSESPRKPSDPAVRKLLRPVSWMLHRRLPLMILREFAGANQGPDEFAQPGFAIAALRQNGFEFLQLVGAGGRLSAAR